MSMMDASVKYLSETNCSEKALRTYLEKEFITSDNLEACINRVVEQLKSFHLVNDLRLARNLAFHYSHKGNRFISDLLKEKGISDDMISETISMLDSEVNRALIETKKRLNGCWDHSEATMAFVYRFLNGRRFSYLTARIVVNELCTQFSHKNKTKVA